MPHLGKMRIAKVTTDTAHRYIAMRQAEKAANATIIDVRII